MYKYNKTLPLRRPHTKLSAFAAAAADLYVHWCARAVVPVVAPSRPQPGTPRPCAGRPPGGRTRPTPFFPVCHRRTAKDKTRRPSTIRRRPTTIASTTCFSRRSRPPYRIRPSYARPSGLHASCTAHQWWSPFNHRVSVLCLFCFLSHVPARPTPV